MSLETAQPKIYDVYLGTAKMLAHNGILTATKAVEQGTEDLAATTRVSVVITREPSIKDAEQLSIEEILAELKLTPPNLTPLRFVETLKTVIPLVPKLLPI